MKVILMLGCICVILTVGYELMSAVKPFSCFQNYTAVNARTEEPLQCGVFQIRSLSGWGIDVAAKEYGRRSINGGFREHAHVEAGGN